MISLSTAWCPPNIPTLPKLFAAGKRIGFTSFELGVSPVPFELDAVLRAIEHNEVAISSVHAVCREGEVPQPTRRGDWIAEPDEERRQEGIRYAKETIDLARRVGARVVVLHGGVLPMPEVPTLQAGLYQLVSEGAPPERIRACLEGVRAEREMLVPAYLRALETTLRELCDYAPDVTLALENRYYLHDVPHGDEFDRIFDHVSAPNLRYWHDVGHAHVLDRLGFVHHTDLLRHYSDRLVGMHLHDVRGFEDHRPPGTGEFDFGLVAGVLRQDTVRVMEIAARHAPADVRRGREHLAETYGIS